MSEPIMIRAMVQMDFAFDPTRVDGRTPEDIIREWFTEPSRGFDSYHAARDAGKVHGASRVIEAKVVDGFGYKLGG